MSGFIGGGGGGGAVVHTLAQVLADGNSADRQINWSTGAGAITHILGPTDRDFRISSDTPAGLNGRTLILQGGPTNFSNTAAGQVSILGGEAGAFNNCVGGSVYIAPGLGTGASGLPTIVFAVADKILGSGSTQHTISQVANFAGGHKSTSGTNPTLTLNPSCADGGTNSTAVPQTLLINPTINYTGASRTGHYEALAVQVVENSNPTGTNLLAAFRGGAAGTSDILILDNASHVTLTRDSAASAASRAILEICRFRSAGAISSGDLLGSLKFSGGVSAGVSNYGASIDVSATGAVASGVVPARVTFSISNPAGANVIDAFAVSLKATTVTSDSIIGFSSSATDLSNAADTTIFRSAPGVTGFGTTGTTANGSWLAQGGTLTAGTVIVSTPPLSITQTWNAAGVTFGGIFMNITNSASQAASTLIDLQVGSVSQFNVARTGAATFLGNVTGASFNTAGSGITIASTGGITRYLSVNTAGHGVPAIYASNRAAAQIAANASVCTFTPAADASLEVSANVLVTTAGTHAFTVVCTYTDEGNTARTLTLDFTLVAGSAIVTSIANANGTVPYHGATRRIRAKGGTAVTIATTGTFTTVTYNVEGTIKQIA